jgi:hypothetical protein
LSNFPEKKQSHKILHSHSPFSDEPRHHIEKIGAGMTGLGSGMRNRKREKAATTSSSDKITGQPRPSTGPRLLESVYPSDTTKGSRAIVRALLMATVNSRWCFAQFPVMRRGMILPLSVVKSRSVCGSLYSIFIFESVQNRQNFLR